jgi:shikimate kinase
MTGNETPLMHRTGQGLALVGYRGAGKSTVGLLLAGMLNRAFVDVDRQIEARSGRSIATIFAEGGEPVFRDWEEQTLALALQENPGGIVATGGGCVVREQNRARMRAFGQIVWLTAHPDELSRRLQADDRGQESRPALTHAGAIDEIASMLQERTPIYGALADLVIETTGKTPEQVAATIVQSWSAWHISLTD